MFIGTMVIELREFNDKKKKNMDKMGKLFLLITLTKNGILVKYLKLKVRTEFPNVWGEYKYHSNPYIQGTTVPCDISVRIHIAHARATGKRKAGSM